MNASQFVEKFRDAAAKEDFINFSDELEKWMITAFYAGVMEVVSNGYKDRLILNGAQFDLRIPFAVSDEFLEQSLANYKKL